MTISVAEHPSQRDSADLLEELGVSGSDGLSSSRAAELLAAHGPNRLREKPPVPLWRRVVKQFQDPLVYLLFVAMGISLVAWIFEGAHGAPIDVIVIAVIVVANAAIGLVQEGKAADAVAALSKMTAANSTVLRDGELTSVPGEDLVPGDILVLAEGDAVGADARLISATGLKVQESSLTGESEAATKDPATLPEKAPLGDRLDMVHKGTAVVQGVGRAVVTSTGMDTEMGAIADMLDSTEEDDSPLTVEINKVSKVLGLLVIGIAVVVMAALFIINDVSSLSEAVDVLLLGVSLAVAAVPEGLPAILSLVLAIGVQALARRNAVMKTLHSAETLGSASVIASDKTGTLTRNEMTLRRIVTTSGVVEFTGTGYDPEGGLAADADDATLQEARLVLGGGAVANNAALAHDDDGWHIQGDPTEGAFLVAQHKLDGIADRAKSFERSAEVPFSSERKMMSVAGREPGSDEDVLFTKGAPDVLLTRCTLERVATGTRPLDDGRREEISAKIEQLSSDGYRTLGVAYRRLGEQVDSLEEDAEQQLVFAGVVGIIDPPRDEAAAAIAEAQGAGIRTMMITGDHPKTAARIAADLGIVDSGDARALTGAQLDKLSDDEFQEATREVDVYARVAPEHKLRIVDALQADGHVVAMTGDGVNDAPALKSADIGVAMGITGTEVTKEAGRMILADDNYATIVAAVRQGRSIFDNIRKFLRFLLSSNMGEVVTVFFGVVLAGVIGLTNRDGGLAVPLLATQILWINLITDSAPALAMGVDPETGGLMQRKPRSPSQPIIDRHMWGRVLFIGIVMGGVSLLSIDMFLPGGMIDGHDSLEVARTVGFTTLVFAQLFNALNSRSDDRSAFVGMFSNHWLWGSIALAAVLQAAVVHLPFMQAAFGTAPLDLAHWAAAVGMASVVLWAEEIVKLARHALHSRHG